MVNRFLVCGLTLISVASRPIIRSRSDGLFSVRSRSVFEISFSRLGRLSKVRCRISSCVVGAESAASPRSNGVSTASASTNRRAVDSNWFGIVYTTTQPTPHTSQAMITPIQRRRHAARRYWESMIRTESISGWSSEPGLRDDQRITGTHFDILLNFTIFDQVGQPYLDALLLARGIDPYHDRAVARREFRHSVRRDHDIQQSHMVAVWNGDRIRCLADHAHLPVRRSDEA